MSATTAALTYRSLFAIREFRVLFLNRCVVVISVAASALALATITYDATRSAVLSGLSMFGGPLVSLVVSQLLLASSDRVRPRTGMMCQMGAALGCDALQLVPSLPWQARFGLLAVPYAAYAMFSGSRWVLVREIVPEESYILARSLMNLADGGMQVAGLSDRPARTVRYGGAAGRGGVVRRTMTVNRRLLGSPLTRPLYIALWVPERSGGRLRVTVRPVRERGIRQARLAHRLAVASTAAGMMAGDLVIGRFVPPGWRDRIIEPLRLLLAVPYLLFFLSPPPAAAIPLGFGAAAGYAASLPLQDRLIRHTDDAIQGQVLGLHMNGMLVWQAIGALIAGTVASWVPPATAMGVMAAASTAVTLALIPGLRRSGSLLTRAQ